jgi:hypothetical protein
MIFSGVEGMCVPARVEKRQRKEDWRLSGKMKNREALVKGTNL